MTTDISEDVKRREETSDLTPDVTLPIGAQRHASVCVSTAETSLSLQCKVRPSVGPCMESPAVGWGRGKVPCDIPLVRLVFFLSVFTGAAVQLKVFFFLVTDTFAETLIKMGFSFYGY